MKTSTYVGLFFAGLLFSFTCALFQHNPGYMDSEYYYAGGIRLAEGYGFTEPFLWNYLDNPVGIPHPSHTYWMPLPSLLSAAGLMLTGKKDYLSARIFFILLSGLIPVLTAYLTFKLSKNIQYSLLSSCLAIFSGFLSVFINLTETFTLYMVLGTLIIVLAFIDDIPLVSGRLSYRRLLGLGILTGLMHLSRADGIIWFVSIFILVLLNILNENKDILYDKKFYKIFSGITMLACLFAGYMIVMGSWYTRNISIYSSLFSPGSSKALWLTNYDQTYQFPADNLTYANWMAAGWMTHINSWTQALLSNFKNIIAVQGEIFLFPLILMGLWGYRKEKLVCFAGLMWVITLGVMTIIFPFSGSRGGFLHSSSAVQLVLWAVVPKGLETFIKVGVKWRNWNAEKAGRNFGIILGVFCLIFTLSIFFIRVIGNDPGKPVWDQSFEQSLMIEKNLSGLGIKPETRIFVNNPPGFYLASGRETLAIPNGGPDILLRAAEKYNTQYLVLEVNHVTGLDDLFMNPRDIPGITLLSKVNPDVQIYKLSP